ncbi:MAG: PHP domain-containing protein [Desulfohalobiaceae bacterium]|nr:PHP domain-containing protein [Desulfohalobiaceae bacterium]
MRIDCHLHTSRYSACSRLDPDTACKRALERGLDAVVITEHQRQWPAEDLAALRRRHPVLTLYNGFEATLENGVDLVVLSEDRGIEVPFGLSTEKFFTSERLDWERSYVFIAHLFRWSTVPPYGLEDLIPFIHGLEMNSVNILRGQFQVRKGRYAPEAGASYRRTRDRFGLQGLFNSDAHDPAAVGSIANEIPCPRPPASEAELASLLKGSTPGEYQDPALLRDLLAPL